MFRSNKNNSSKKSNLLFSDDLCGIFVKSVAENSAAAKEGRIQVNDQIIKVITGDVLIPKYLWSIVNKNLSTATRCYLVSSTHPFVHDYFCLAEHLGRLIYWFSMITYDPFLLWKLIWKLLLWCSWWPPLIEIFWITLN